MAFDTTGLDAACLDIGDDFNDGAFQMVPAFTEVTSGSDGYQVSIGEQLTAQTSQAVITANSITTDSVLTHDRTGNEFVVLGLMPDAENWVTVHLERNA